jgi:hypothetical protein
VPRSRPWESRLQIVGQPSIPTPFLIPLHTPVVLYAGFTALCSRSLPSSFRRPGKKPQPWEILPAAVPALQPAIGSPVCSSPLLIAPYPPIAMVSHHLIWRRHSRAWLRPWESRLKIVGQPSIPTPFLIPLRTPALPVVLCAGSTASAPVPFPFGQPGTVANSRGRGKSCQQPFWPSSPQSALAPLVRSSPAPYPSLSTPRDCLPHSIWRHWRHFLRPPLIFTLRIALGTPCSIGSSGWGSDSSFLHVSHLSSQITRTADGF